jgi:hypothetical protein
MDRNDCVIRLARAVRVIMAQEGRSFYEAFDTAFQTSNLLPDEKKQARKEVGSINGHVAVAKRRREMTRQSSNVRPQKITTILLGTSGQTSFDLVPRRGEFLEVKYPD